MHTSSINFVDERSGDLYTSSFNGMTLYDVWNNTVCMACIRVEMRFMCICIAHAGTLMYLLMFDLKMVHNRRSVSYWEVESSVPKLTCNDAPYMKSFPKENFFTPSRCICFICQIKFIIMVLS